MFNLKYVARACAALCLVAAFVVTEPSFAQTASPPATAADLAKLQDTIQAMRVLYENRINSLEQKITTLEQQNTQLARQQGAAPTTGRPAATSVTVSPAAPLAPAALALANGKATTSPIPVATTVGASPTSGSAVAGAPDLGRNPPSSLGRGIVLPKIGPITPEISLIIDGKYSAQSQNPETLGRGFVPSGGENIPRGFSLGETELALAGTVDNLFRAEAR